MRHECKKRSVIGRNIAQADSKAKQQDHIYLRVLREKPAIAGVFGQKPTDKNEQNEGQKQSKKGAYNRLKLRDNRKRIGIDRQ